VHTGRLQFSNAGHPYPLIIRKSGEVITLETEGTVIGLGGMMPFSTGDISIYPGDLLVLYTDGLFEQTNAAGCQFGWEEMCRALVDSRHLPAQEIAATIQESVRRFAAHRALEDDISLICLKYSQL
jgi:sigma-B regulation protein RsbU (phosphoserine phosphatase)